METDASKDGAELALHLHHELKQDVEDEVVYRQGVRHSRKLMRSTQHTIGAVQLQLEQRGKLQYMAVLPQPPVNITLEEDQVQVRVCAVGLNFKDVLNVLMPDEAAYLGEVPLPGADFAGVVTALPKCEHDDHDDAHLAVNDRVFGMCMEGSGMLRSQATVYRSCVAKMPRGVTFEEAAVMPMVFMTVEFALGEQAKLQSGQRVLIHSAAGGVGLAAIQFAQRVGAELFATASAPKHEYLRSLGVKHISTTRDEQVFAREMSAMVTVRGVDVVLNSLTSGDYIGKTVALLSPSARWIEIGKRNIWSHTRMQSERPDVKYVTHSLNELLPSEPERLVPMLQDLAAHVEAGVVQPLPMKVFQMRGELVEAFRWLQSGQAIGKVVVRVERSLEVCPVNDGKGAVLVTGGLGGLGIVTAEALVEVGARCVVLVSRSGKIKYTNQGLGERLEALRTSGARVVLERCDTSDDAQVEALLERVRECYGPLRVVVHAAGVLSDALLMKQDCDSIRRVWRPKADGAWFLHKHTMSKDTELKSFVVYSSVAALFGNAGQANYSAANAYLDGLVRWRVAQGLPGTSVQWPAVLGVGMAAAMEAGTRIGENLSVGAKTVKMVIKQVVLGSHLSEPVQAVIPRGMLEVGAMPSTVTSLVESVRFKPAGGKSRRGLQVGQPGQSAALDSRWHGMGSDDIRRLSSDVVTSQVRALLCEEDLEGGVDPSTPLMDVGLDSLASTQLVQGLSENLGVKLPPTLLFDYPTINVLSDHLTALVMEDMAMLQGTGDNENQRAMGGSVSPHEREVAITGMSCRFPGGIEGPAMFWDSIQAGRCMAGKVPFRRWDVNAVTAQEVGLSEQVKSRMMWGCFVEDLELFDASFFKISTAEVSAMDPQQRLLLEYSYLALHDAGYTKEALKRCNMGVFVGIGGIDAAEVAGRSDSQVSVYSANGTSNSTAAGRVSFVFGLQGPCVAYDTACSSALVALHAAVRCLQAGDCELAMMASVNVMLTPTISRSFAIAGMTSPTGRCHTFDESADGYCRGEGCSAVVLKRMGDAHSDQDRVYAVVRGVSVAQDGTSASLTAPNGQAQEKLLHAALRDAGLASHELDYLETHGTGTALGDPIEMGALAAVMGQSRGDEYPLVIGSAKANVGHLEAAAGITGFFCSIAIAPVRCCRFCLLLFVHSAVAWFVWCSVHLFVMLNISSTETFGGSILFHHSRNTLNAANEMHNEMHIQKTQKSAKCHDRF